MAQVLPIMASPAQRPPGFILFTMFYSLYNLYFFCHPNTVIIIAHLFCPLCFLQIESPLRQIVISDIGLFE